jgi:hypothetical protein
MADTATTEARLAEAEAALHRLLTGSQLEELRHSAGAVSRSARYTAANIGELRGYIAQLKRELGQPSGRRAIGVRFA